MSVHILSLISFPNKDNMASNIYFYTINIIDTPGFGDTRGLDHDKRIVNQIRELFASRGAKGVATIDAVCFILKAPDSRLTSTQKYQGDWLYYYAWCSK
jgi:predicted GTPase